MKSKRDIAVSIKDITKQFVLPHQRVGTLKSYFVSPFVRTDREKQLALSNVSLDIEKGDFFGIVGRNGSGKSTLLKCIAGVYAPDKGSVEVNGSLVPFIELGVGFNPDLTGRDNIYLNGALLGFSRAEMSEMYDDIVKFAELEQFMDQKLKNYSSGMQVRLAFSIAIQAKGDVLLLDEVLAVGDAEFQKKCNDYFEELKKENKTVILVTHDMNAVKRFCTKAMLVEGGRVKKTGSPTEVANQYSLDNMNAGVKSDSQGGKNSSLSGPVKQLDVRPISPKKLTNDDSFEIEITYELERNIDVDLGIAIICEGRSVVEHNTKELKLGNKKDTPYKIRYIIPLKYFTAKQFSIDVAIFQRKDFKLIGFNTNACSFMITSEDGPRGGILNKRGEWIIKGKTP